MNTKILYIIGNGFDLHHGIASSYWNFRNYVKTKNTKLFDTLERYFNPDLLWSDFEGTLADLDTEHILDEASNYLVGYGSENWSEAFHHDYQYEIGERVKLITSELKKNFTEWILSLEIPSSREDMLKLDREAIFLNFNYTPTLSKLYKVDKKHITYIHNEAESESSELLMGHGIDPEPMPKRGGEHEDPRVTEGQEIIDGYFLESYKPVGKIIIEKQKFFDSLSQVEEVNIYGHSMSEVDMLYFEKIVESLDIDKVKWRASYFAKGEDKAKLEMLVALGVPVDHITIDKLGNFDTSQLSLL